MVHRALRLTPEVIMVKNSQEILMIFSSWGLSDVPTERPAVYWVPYLLSFLRRPLLSLYHHPHFVCVCVY